MEEQKYWYCEECGATYLADDDVEVGDTDECMECDEGVVEAMPESKVFVMRK
jgi:hypothetical protein